MSRQNTKNGFSLIELLIVLMIVTITSAFALPATTALLYNYRLRSAVSSATWAIQSTRFQALEQGYPYRVTFSGGTGGVNPSYQIANETIGAVSFTNVGTSVPLSGAPVTLSATTVLQFSPNGSVTATTGALNFNIAYQGSTKTVTVSNYGNVNVTP